jgi:hypothetical protein
MQNYICEFSVKREFEERGFSWENYLKIEYLYIGSTWGRFWKWR